MADVLPSPTLTAPAGLDAGTRREFEQLISQLQQQTRRINRALAAAGTGGGPGGPGMNLDYLGAYDPPVTYNDGDIVIAEDGIAYMCVVDGTNTPPEPWPGTGISTVVGPPGPPGPAGPPGEGAVDATYWTSTAHVTLTAERNFGALATGYVKSLVTDFVSNPTTIAVIPLTDGGTGATTAPQARTNLGLGTMAVQNHYDVGITGGQFSVRSGEITAATEPSLALTNTGAANTLWLIKANPDTNLNLWSYNTDGSAGVASVTISRAGVITANGSGLTNLHAPNIATGLVPTARLGGGAANAGTFLRGDQTWQSMAGVPSGLIMLSLGSCPPGWTRVNLDGYFLRVAASAGATGGAATHSHDAGSLSAANHNHGGSVGISGTTAGAGGHGHAVSASGSGTTAMSGTTNFNFEAGAAVFNSPGNHAHTFSVNVSGVTDNANDHQHGFSGSGGIPSEAPGVTGATALASSLPPFFEVVLCQKD